MQKIKPKLVNVGYAPIESVEKDTITYGTPVYFATAEAGGREYSMSPSGTNKKIYANSQMVYCGEENDGYEIELTLIAVLDDVRVAWFDDIKCENGILEVNKNKDKPRFALILSDQDTSDVGKTEILYYCQVSERMEIAGKTAEAGDWEEQFPTFKIKASPRPNDNYVRFTVDGVEELKSIPEPVLLED